MSFSANNSRTETSGLLRCYTVQNGKYVSASACRRIIVSSSSGSVLLDREMKALDFTKLR